MQALSFLFVLSLIVFATATKDEKNRKTQKEHHLFPHHVDHFASKYEGNLLIFTKGKEQSIPVTGELFYRHEGNKFDIFDKSNLNLGQNFVVMKWFNLDAANNKITKNYHVQDKCVRITLSKDKGTFPDLGEWKKVGDKYERTMSINAKLSDLFPNVKGLDSTKREIQIREEISLENNKPKQAKCTVMIDGKKVAVKDVRFTEEIKKSDMKQVFTVPEDCKDASKIKKEDLAIETLPLGLRFEDIQKRLSEKKRE